MDSPMSFELFDLKKNTNWWHFAVKCMCCAAHTSNVDIKDWSLVKTCDKKIFFIICDFI